MSECYVIQNQQGYYVTRQREWTDGRDPKPVYRTKFKDEAINWVFELSSKDIDLRAMVIATEFDEKGQPVLDIIAPPMPKPEQNQTLAFDDETVNTEGNTEPEPTEPNKVEQSAESQSLESALHNPLKRLSF